MFLTLVLIVSISLLIIVARSTYYVEIDGVELNGIVQTAKENWSDLSVLDSKNYDKDILVLSGNNEVL